MKKTAFILFISLFGLSACATTEAISQAEKPDSKSTQSVSDQSNQQQLKDKSGLYEKLVKENTELSARLKEANNKIADLQDRAQDLSARLEQQQAASAPAASIAEIDLDVYSRGVSDTASVQAADVMKLKGFHPKYPALPKTMTMSRATTVYYYDNSYMPVAGVLAQDIANILNRKVVARRGASSFAKNKIIVHMRGK